MLELPLEVPDDRIRQARVAGVAIYPPYEAYQSNAGARMIPVVLLKPR